MPKNKPILQKVSFFGMISTLSLELSVGTSMMLSGIVVLMYYKVSKRSKSLGTCISPLKLCKYCVN